MPRRGSRSNPSVPNWVPLAGLAGAGALVAWSLAARPGPVVAPRVLQDAVVIAAYNAGWSDQAPESGATLDPERLVTDLNAASARAGLPALAASSVSFADLVRRVAELYRRLRPGALRVYPYTYDQRYIDEIHAQALRIDRGFPLMQINATPAAG